MVDGRSELPPASRFSLPVSSLSLALLPPSLEEGWPGQVADCQSSPVSGQAISLPHGDVIVTSPKRDKGEDSTQG